MFLNKIRNIFCPADTKFVSATNVARAGKRGNICVGNNVFAAVCPRLPGPLAPVLARIIAYVRVNERTKLNATPWPATRTNASRGQPNLAK